MHLKEDWNDSVKEAWVAAYGVITNVMMGDYFPNFKPEEVKYPDYVKLRADYHAKLKQEEENSEKSEKSGLFSL